MGQEFELGKWIRARWKSQVAFSEKLGVNQARVSKWLSLSEGISAEYGEKIRKLGYAGPWPKEEARESAAPPAMPEEVVKLKGRVEALEGQLLAALVAAKSLDQRVQELERRAGLTG